MTAEPSRIRWRWYGRLRGKLGLLEDHALFFNRLELVFACLLIASTLAVFLAHLLPACRGSLWGDEIYTVSHFSDKGPLKVITDYSKPNNHVFFNLLNSVQPFGDPYHPLVARFFSFSIMAFGMVCLFYRKWSRLKFNEAALVSFILFTNSSILDLCFQARGYGWIFGSALIISLQMLRYFDTGDRASLVWIGAFTVIGTYTLPTFIFFGGAALLLMFFAAPKREIFYTGLAALFLISLLYLPLAFQILKVFSKYESGGRKAFADFNQIGGVFRNFFFDFPLPVAFIVGMSLWLAPWATNRPGGQRRAIQILALSLLAALAVSLLMETAKARTLVYIGIPCSLAVLLYWRSILEKLSLRVLQAGLFCTVAAFGIARNIQHAKNYEYEPLDDWVTLGKLVAQLQSPKSFVFMQRDSYLLEPYLPSRVKLTSSFDQESFSRGELSCVASETSTTKPINREADLTTQFPFAFVQYSRSKRANSFPLWSVVPQTRMIPSISVENVGLEDGKIFDRNPKTGVALAPTTGLARKVHLGKLENAHSLFLIFSQDILAEDISGNLSDKEGKTIRAAKIYISGRVACIPLSKSQLFTVNLSISNRIKPLQLNEVWAVLKVESPKK